MQLEQRRPPTPEHAQENVPEHAPELTAPVAGPGPKVTVKRDGQDFRASWVPFQVLLGVGVGALVLAWALPANPHGPLGRWDDARALGAALALSTGLGCLLHAFLVHPLFVLARVTRAETARLRAALACPYCRDGIAEDQAMACGRSGCGAIYHTECWQEVRPSYGGCAVYGCGSPAAHPVGRFAIQRRLLRLVVAAALFPPTAVRRLRQTDRRTFRDLWAQARAWQQGVSGDGRALVAGLVDASIVLPLTVSLVFAIIDDPTAFGLGFHSPYYSQPDWDLVALAVGGVSLVGCVLAVLLMRLPLLAAFGLGVMRLVARMFTDELAALSRADEGTFLARLAGGLGKKSE